ncbi:MAG: hypothetical protein K9H16_13280 [Bacteroidales bacterium]|nr:hypothetical protein [Bacteroidales bacterium]
MTTIKVSVKSDSDAQILINLLNTMKMELSIESDIEASEQKNQFQQLNAVLKKYASKDLFNKIDDPVAWQKELRDEW